MSVPAHRNRARLWLSRYGRSGSISINETGLFAVRNDGEDEGSDVEEREKTVSGSRSRTRAMALIVFLTAANADAITLALHFAPPQPPIFARLATARARPSTRLDDNKLMLLSHSPSLQTSRAY